MVEFTLVVPLLAIILGLTFFFGWAYLHKHQVIIASRYATWQRVEKGTWPAEEKLNDLCFAKRAMNVQFEAMGGKRETARDLHAEVGAESHRAETFADELLMTRFPGGRRGHVSARFSSNRALWQQFRGHIHDHHAREGITWRRDEVNCWPLLRDQYYWDLDGRLRRVPAPGDGMARVVRKLYLAHW
jgi:hypothetical protein